MHGRLTYIDCLRGVAISGVVLVHSGQLVDGLPCWLHSLSDYGGRGVNLFFILSALTLITAHNGKPFSAASFFIRRFFRVAPMFLLGALLYYTLGRIAPNLALPSTIPNPLPWHGPILAFIDDAVPGGWSIADEALFYLLFPFLLLFLVTPTRIAAAMATAIVCSRLSFILTPHLFAEKPLPDALRHIAAFAFPTQWPAFVGGFAAYAVIEWIHAHPEYHPFIKEHAQGWLLTACGIVVAWAASGNGVLVNCLTADLLLLAFVITAYLAQSRLIVNEPLRRLGTISYSVYILHFAIVFMVRDYVIPALPPLDPSLLLAMIFPAILVLSAFFAAIVYRFVETPMIEAGRKLSHRVALASRHDEQFSL